MNTQVIITQDEAGQYWVSGRSLFNIMSSYKPSNFVSWARNRIKTMTMGKDYLISNSYENPDYKPGSNNQKRLTEYLFSINCAKRICLIENSSETLDQIERFEKTIHVAGIDDTSKTLPLFNQQDNTLSNPKGEPIKPLLNVVKREDIGLSVSGRELYYLIARGASRSAKDIFSDWFLDRKAKFNLVANKDYIRIDGGYREPGKSRSSIEYILTIETAKVFARYQLVNRGMPAFDFLSNYTEPTSDVVTTGDDKLIITQTEQKELDIQSLQVPLRTSVPQQQSSAAIPLTTQALPTAEKKIANTSTPRTALQELLQRVEEAASIEETVMAHEAMFDDHQTRLVAVETKVDALVNFFRQAALVLFGELPVGPPPAEVATVTTTDQVEEHFALEPQMLSEAPTEAHVPLTPRAAMVQQVRDFAAHTKIDHEELWRHLYKRLFEKTGFNVSKHKTQADKSYMNVVVRHNQLENLIAIVTAELLPKMGVSVG